MKQFFAYIRVSTAKQGERGVSLQEQRDAITRFAEHQGLTITSWFEERETAAKRGRPIFTQMLALLAKGGANGIVIHKIDRSARNLKDWADLGELIDHGVTVHFANESLDLASRGGRLSADIQAVVAADYIRNLREETKKGFYGRLKQGIYPLPAPVGYVNRGKGQRKEHDPVKGPLVAQAFALYATGRYSLDTLTEEMHRRGLRNRRGGRLSLNGMSTVLNNPFYAGLIRLKRTHETFQGTHTPLVSKRVFDQVKAVLTGKVNVRTVQHDFLFRRLLRCEACNLTLIGERQKGHVYYRCHTKGCVTIREEAAESAIMARLRSIAFSDDEMRYLASALPRLTEEMANHREDAKKAVALQAASLEERLDRLTDAYLDGTLDKEAFERRKVAALLERQRLKEASQELDGDQTSTVDQVAKILELAKSAYLLYEAANPQEKRELVLTLTSNRTVAPENVAITLAPGFRLIENRPAFPCSSPYRGVPRTVSQFLASLVKSVSNVETPMTN